MIENKKMKFIVLLTTMLTCVVNFGGLNIETGIKLDNEMYVPFVTVVKKDDVVTWRVYVQDGYESVLLNNLGKEDAETLLFMSQEANRVGQEILEQGVCVDTRVTSDSVGKIVSSTKSTMDAKVTCRNNSNFTMMTLMDEYAIEIVFVNKPWHKFEALAKKILEHY